MDIKNENVEVKFLENNILHIKWLKGGFTLENIKNMIAQIREIHGVGPFLFLIDIKNVKNISKPMRDYFKSHEYVSLVRASAILVDNGISKIIANTTTMFIRPPYPIKMFLDIQAAIDWLIKH